MAYTNPNQIIRLRSRMGGRGSVYEANAWAQQYKANTGITSGSDAQLVGYMAGSAGVTQNTSADMNVIVNGTPTNPSVVLGVNPAGYKIALDIIGSTVLPITAPASNSRYSLVVAYADDLSLASSDTTITGNPSKNGVIVVNGASAATPAFPMDADIRAAITADGATGSQAVYAILSYGIIASTTTTITNALLTMPNAVMSLHNITFPIGFTLFLNTESTPSQLGFVGTWVEIAQGRAIVGVDSTDSTISTAGKMVGSVNPLTAHTHTIHHNSGAAAVPAGSSIGVATDGDGTSASAGDNTNHNNWQPSLALHIWNRTA